MADRLATHPTRLGAIVVVAGLLAVSLPGPAFAATDPNTLVASLNGANMGDPSGDPDGLGTFSITLDPALGQGCFVLDISLTDLAGDPPTAVDVHDSATGDPGDVVLALATGVDGAGHAEGCVPVSAPLIGLLFATPNSYSIDVHTAGYPEGAIRGWLDYSYPTGPLSVYTRVCPASIQSVAQLTETAKASCLVVVLPPDDVTPYVPDGYTVTGYGGTATFDYHVTDGKHLDATIADASRGGGGTCSAATESCDFAWLPYDWSAAALGEIHVQPTLLPAGTRLGAAEARDVQEPGDPFPTSIGTGNDITVDATGGYGAAVFVYLFRTADTSAPSVSTPRVSLRSGTTFGSRLPVQLTWSGSDTGSGIDHYAVQRRVDGGAWTTIASVNGTAYNTSLATGHAYRFRVRAYDKAGNARWSGETVRQHGRVVQDSSSSVRYGGTWRRAITSSASGGSLRYAIAAGATARFTFTGRAIAWVAPKSLSRGAARIYIDGTYVATVNLYGPSTARQVVFAKRFSGLGTHTIKVRIVGTAGHPRVDVDAFLYLN